MMTDPDVLFLEGLAPFLEAKYINEEEKRIWSDSPFCWIKCQPSRRVGKIGEDLVARWAASKGFAVARSSNSDHDLKIEGRKVEVKFSTLWTKEKEFRFQQIRDQDYEFVFLLGLSPFDAQAWFVPKAELAYDRPPWLKPQHGGAKGKDTRWLAFPAASPPHWLGQFGGRLSEVAALIKAAAE